MFVLNYLLKNISSVNLFSPRLLIIVLLLLFLSIEECQTKGLKKIKVSSNNTIKVDSSLDDTPMGRPPYGVSPKK